MPDDRWRELFSRTRKELPRAAAAGRIVAASHGDEVELTWNGPATRMLFFPASDGMIENAAKQVAVEYVTAGSSPQTMHRVTSVMLTPATERTGPLTRVSGVLVIGSADARHAYAVDVPVGVKTVEPVDQARARPFASLESRHVFVLLGGVLLGFVLIWVIRKRGRPAG